MTAKPITDDALAELVDLLLEMGKIDACPTEKRITQITFRLARAVPALISRIHAEQEAREKAEAERDDLVRIGTEARLYLEQAEAALSASQKRARELETTLREIAVFGDEQANEHLRITGSFGGFDEPGSVEIARTTLSETQEN